MDEDDEFEVTAEMLIHEDVDDELTLAEAEAEQSAGEVEEEVEDLQQESELPLQELLKRYGYALAGESETADSLTEEEEGENEREPTGEVRGRERDEEVISSRGVKRGRIRDGLLDDDEVSSTDVKKVNVEQESIPVTIGEISSHSPEFVDKFHVGLNERVRDSSSLDDVGEQVSSTTATSGGGSGDAPSSGSSNHHLRHYIHRSNPITSQQTAAESVTQQYQSRHPSSHSYTSPLPLLGFSTKIIPLDSQTPSLPQQMPSPSYSSSVVQEQTAVLVANREVSHNMSSVFLAGADDHLLLGDPLLTGEGVERGRGGGGERSDDREQLERSPRLTDGYSSDPLSSSDGQSHTPSSGSFHTSSSSSFSGSGGGGRLPHSDIKSRLRPELPERRSMRLMANDEKLLDSYFSAFSDDDEGDDEYVPVEDWKQEIRVGASYQVEVEPRPSREPYTSQRESPDCLLWRPRSPEEKVVSYLKAVSTVVRPDSGNSSRDTEQALKLLQECGHDVQRAIDVVQEQGLPSGTKPWTELECDEFEEGLRVSGKDFFQLKKLVPSRSVKELVEFYYVWKKSKRYEDFIRHGKIGKKKITFQPGQVCDFMDNYLNVQDMTAPELHYATTTPYAEHKKETV